MDKVNLILGDCLKLMKDIPDKSIDAIVTDPPYLYLNHKLDKPFDEDAVFEEWNRILKDDGFIVIFGRGESFYRWNTKLIGLGFEFKEEIIWVKNRVSNVFGPVGRNHETVSLLTKKGGVRPVKIPYVEHRAKELNGAELALENLKRIVSELKNPIKGKAIIDYLEKSIFTCNEQNAKGIASSREMKPSTGLSVVKSVSEGLRIRSAIKIKTDNRKSHPTEKPVRLMEHLINLVSDEGSLVLDSFLGSGSTAIACLNTNRKFIGYEIDEEYFDIATKRIEEHEQQLKMV